MTTVNVLNDTVDLAKEGTREVFSIHKNTIDSWFDCWIRHLEEDNSKEHLKHSYNMCHSAILCSYMHIREVKWCADNNIGLGINEYEKELIARINEMAAQFTTRLTELD